MTQLHNTKRKQNSQSGRVGLAGATIGSRIQIQKYIIAKDASIGASLQLSRRYVHSRPTRWLYIEFDMRTDDGYWFVSSFLFYSLSSICLLFSSGTSLRMQWISLSFWQRSTNCIISIRDMVVTASTCRTETVFDYSWKHVVCAYWNRYPNPSRWVTASWLSNLADTLTSFHSHLVQHSCPNRGHNQAGGTRWQIILASSAVQNKSRTQVGSALLQQCAGQDCWGLCAGPSEKDIYNIHPQPGNEKDNGEHTERTLEHRVAPANNN